VTCHRRCRRRKALPRRRRSIEGVPCRPGGDHRCSTARPPRAIDTQAAGVLKGCMGRRRTPAGIDCSSDRRPALPRVNLLPLQSLSSTPTAAKSWFAALAHLPQSCCTASISRVSTRPDDEQLPRGPRLGAINIQI